MKKNTPKRRLASTRNMSKQDKRRVQLHKTTKNKAEQKTRSGRVMFSRPDDSTLFVRGNRSEAAAKTPLNKRLIALVLAVVMILALIPAGIFMLRPKAAGTTPMESTPMTVRINGKSSGTAMIQPGSIAENIAENDIDYGEVVIPSGAEFVKAVLVDENNIETQIYSVASKGDTNYYSIAQDAYTGVAKDQDEELVLVFANKYYIDFGTAQMNGNGYFENAGVTFTTNATPEVNVDSNETKYFIYGGQDLEIKEIKAKLDKSLGKVEYSTGSNAGAETIKNSRVTIPSNMYDGEIHVQVNYGELDEYTVQDARYMANSKYYAQYAKLDNHGGTSLSSTAKGTTNSLGTVDKGQTKTFYVFSQLNSTSSQVWRLSMLSLNGVDLNFPTDTETTALTSVRDFGNVEVRYMGDLNMDGESKTRAVYELKVPNVHENVEVNYYFTNIKERQLIIKGLNGINKTAASVENKMISGNLTGKWYTYTEDKLNVYDAFYDSRKNFPADNLVLYTVKPGYNPYAISTTLYADGEDVTNKIRATNATGTPLEVIAQAGNAEGGNFDTDWRYWGENNGELHNTDKKHWGDELLLTTIKKDKDNTWYAVALAQSKKTNQQLVLNAPEYKYAIEVDLNGGDLTATGYTTASGLMNEDVTHTIADASPFMFLPAGTPTQAGKIFAGYRLVNIDSETGNLKDSYADDNKYMPSDRINIDSTALDYAYGNRKDPNNSTLKVRFKAIWKDGKNTTNVNVTTQYQTGVSEDGSPDYGTTASSVTETSTVGDAAVLNDHLTDGSGNALAKNKYYALSSDSVIVGDTSDDFVVKYDYNLLDLTVKKTVLGYPKTQSFPITVTLTPGADSPVSIDDELLVLNKTGTYATKSEDNGSIIYTRNLKDSQSYTIEVPYNWNYVVSEPTKEKDYINTIEPSEGKMTKHQMVDVTNIDDSSVVGTNKTLSGPDANGEYTITLDSWATGQSFTKPKQNLTNLDIALVIDQSGSMATKDMNGSFEVAKDDDVPITEWTIESATGDTQYYYQPDPNKAEFFPVVAEKGPLYEAVPDKVYISKMIGGGHDGLVSVTGSPCYFNVPTDYYCMVNGKPHKVYVITVGETAQYAAYTYYYTDINEAKRVATSYERDSMFGSKYVHYDNVVANNNNPYNNGNEWVDRIAWLDASAIADLIAGRFSGFWESSNFHKFTDREVRSFFNNDSNYVTSATFFNGSYKWTSLAYNKQVCYVGQPDASMSSAENNKMHYSWFSSGSDANANHDLYQKKSGTTYNTLAYVDANGIKHAIGTTYMENQIAYTGNLYVKNGDARVKVLKTAAQEFAEAIAENARDYDLDHRMAIIGFAGNKVPGYSNGEYNYSGYNYENDYVNTGLFVETEADGSGGFRNYQKITGFNEYSGTKYINRHYYIKDANLAEGHQYVPVKYSSSGVWYRMDTRQEVGVSETFYEPIYENLNDSNGHNYYKDALLTVYDENEQTGNALNDSIDSAISKFKARGGTYTSYGMAMANQVFENNSIQDNENRKRVIVVFSDGEPGSNGYDSSIAGEAWSESSKAKDQDIAIYTIGLFPTHASSEAEQFLDTLSSNYSLSLSDVNATSKNAIQGDTDASNTYYYTDKDGKVYSLTAKRNGLSTLGWWITYDDNDSPFYVSIDPKNKRDAIQGEDQREGTIYFYRNDNGTLKPVYADGTGNEAISQNNTYYTSDGYPIRYEYRWYDSNDRVKDPKWNDGEDYSWAVQFQKLDSGSKTNNQYYFKESDATGLADAFNSIYQMAVQNTTNIGLNEKNTMMQDIITSNFDATNASYTVEKVAAKMKDGIVSPITGSEASSAIITDDVTVVFDTNDEENPESTITVTGFDYGSEDNYISENHNGNLMRVTITGLKPNKTGFDLPSNTNESGVYEVLYPDDDYTKEPTGKKKILDDFDLPEVDRPTYSLVVRGDDKGTDYIVKFTLKDKDGTSVTDTLNQPVLVTTGETTALSTLQFSNGEATWTTSKASDSDKTIVFENLPDGYSVDAKVTKNTDSTLYDYSMEVVDSSGKKLVTPDPTIDGTEFDLPQSGSVIKINSTRHTAKVTLREQTRQSDDTEGGNADPDKLFDIQLKLTREDGSNLGEAVTYSGVEFDAEGNATIQMKHDQVRTLDLPEGFKLAIDVNPDTQDLYLDTYTKGTSINDGVAYGTDEYPATVIENGQYITIFNKIDFPLPTGLFGSNVPVSAILLGVAGVLVLAVAGAYVYRRKRWTSKR